MPDMHPDRTKITEWPPRLRPAIQVTREQLRHMTPEAINQAREGGALDDLMSGKQEAE